MGWTWEVNAWCGSGSGYEWVQVFAGESLVRALLAARKAKRTAGCVKVEWRS